jgi:hypothetical protein
MRALIASMPEYSDNKKLLDAWTKRAYTSAFDAAYSMGGRRTSARFDHAKYVGAFFEKMIDLARASKKTKLEDALVRLQQEARGG